MKNKIFLTSMLAVLITGPAAAVVIGPNDSTADCKSPDIGQNTTSGSVKYRAKWTPNDYEIFLSGGTSSLAKIIETYDSAHWKDASGTDLATGSDPDVVPIPTYDKAVFVGYYDGNTRAIDDSGKILIGTTTYNDENTTDRQATLNAEFESCACVNGANVKSCTVEGVGTDENENKCYYEYTCEAGYHLNGGNPDNITDNFYGGFATASNTSPDCIANTIDLAWDANGGTINTEGGTTCDYGSLTTDASGYVEVAQVANRTGYTFNGWEVACSGRVATYNSNTGECTCLSGYDPILNADGSITCGKCDVGESFNASTHQCE